MTSRDRRPDITPVGQAISWRTGLLVSIIVHLAMIVVLLLSPRLLSHDPAEDLARARLALFELQRPPQETRFVVDPKADVESLPPPDLAPISDKNRVARSAELIATPTNPLLNSRGITPDRVELVETGSGPRRVTRPDASLEKAEASVPGASAAHALPGGPSGDAMRALERHTKPEQFENTQGGAWTPTAWAAIELVGNHLWQSTLCLAVAALLTLALRRNRARVRYGIWVAASLKFIVPFGPLMALGRQFGWRTPETGVQPTMTVLMDTMSQPFSRPLTAIATTAPHTSSYDVAALLPLLLLAIWLSGSVVILLTWWVGWRRLTNVVRNASPIRQGHELDVLRRLEARAGIRVPTTLVSSDTSLEPGVFGLMTLVLLWPRGMAEHLTAAQIEALLAHEVCHVRRRDNLVAAVHMFIEALFWFHPLIWWLETRLVDERERACDEEVVRCGHDPVVYAESILKTCEFYAESPLTCVPGVTGADLKKRIESIMRNKDGEVLGAWRKLLLTAAGTATIAAPIVIGMLGAPLLRAQSPAGSEGGPAFEVASVKPNKVGDPGRRVLAPQPGGRLTATNVMAAELIRFAYELSDFQVLGGPAWLNSDRFDVVAKAEGDPPLAQKRLMLRRLLADRFKLTAHTETRQLPIYAMVMARSDGRMGRQLRRAEADCAHAAQSFEPGIGLSPGNGPPSCGFFGFAPGTDFRAGRGGIAFRGLTMAALAKVFVPMLRRSVSDQTGLTGYFDAEFDFIAELPIPPPPPGLPNPTFDAPFVSVFTVLPEQLGLKLDSRRGPVEVLVIDRVEQPTPD